MKKVAFLGLGAMGSRMAKNILASGFDVTVWNRTTAAAAPLQQAGAHVANSPRQAAEEADIVIAMLTDDEASKKVWTDETDGALAGMKKDALAIEMSTLTPAWVKELANIATSRGVRVFDAPVSGSLPQAEGRHLVIMVGGDAQAFGSANIVLSTMGAAHYVGPIGSGAVMKLAVNSLLGIQIAAWAEILGFVQKNGINLSDALNLLTTMSICSPTAAGSAKMMVARDFAPRFPNTLLAKDYRYVQQTAAKADSKIPICNAASEVFQSAAKEMGNENFTSVIRFYE